MFSTTLKISVFTVSYSSLGQTRLCPKDCSIKKQRFSAILWHFIEHFWRLVMLFAGYLLPVLAIRQRLVTSCLPALGLLPEDSFGIPHCQRTLFQLHSRCRMRDSICILALYR